MTFGNWRDPVFARRSGNIFLNEALDDLDHFRTDQGAQWTDDLPTEGYVFVNDTKGGGLEFAMIQDKRREPACDLTYESVETILYGLQKVFRFPVQGGNITTNSFLMKIRREKAWVYIAEGAFTGFHSAKKEGSLVRIEEQSI